VRDALLALPILESPLELALFEEAAQLIAPPGGPDTPSAPAWIA
jgi:hypothetical protein